MKKSNDQKRASKQKSPWNHSRVGKYSLEEVALEFILWEDEAAHSHTLKRHFIHEALEENFGHESVDETLARFVQVYERLYGKIYRHKLVEQDRETPDTIRQLLNLNIKRNAA